MSSAIKALKKYQELICNFQKRNRELLYKGSPNSICLSNIVVPKECSEPAKLRALFQPARLENVSFVESIDSGKLVLDDHFYLKYENPAMRRRINSLRNADDNFQKEFGISGAWFVGPFLLWRTKEMIGELDNIFISPILKNPIDIKKNKSKNDTVEFEESGLHHINPTLRILLKKEYGVDLDKQYNGTLHEVLKLIEEKFREAKISLTFNIPEGEVFKLPAKTKTIVNEEGEKLRIQIPLEESLSKSDLDLLSKVKTSEFIVQDTFYLDVFDASKMSLYYDYEEIIEKFETKNSSLISSLVDENVYLNESKKEPTECESENFYVVDIDGSQHKAIKKCQDNEGFVIQGPPGTGKSQTITNLISQLLSQGKKVLFVAEKRAALDVVYSRLCGTGLGRHSVILHDNEVNKNALYKSYVEAFQEKTDGTVASKWNDMTETLNIQTRNVALYFDELHQNTKYSGMSNFEFLSMISKAPKKDFNHSLYKYVSHLEWNNMLKSRQVIQDTEKMYNTFNRYEETYWRLYNQGEFVNDVKVKEFEDLKSDFLIQSETFHSSLALLSQKFPGGEHDLIHEIKTDISIVSDFEVASLMVNNYLNTSKAKLMLLDLKDKVSSLKGKLSSFKLIKPGITEDKILMLRDYFSKPKSFLKYFSFKYWKMISIGKLAIEDKSQIENANVYSDWLIFNQFENEISSAIDLVYKSVTLSRKDKDGQIEELDQYLSFANFILRVKNTVGGKRFDSDFTPSSLKTLILDFRDSIPFSASLVNSKKTMMEIKEKTDANFSSVLNDDFKLYFEVLNNLIATKQDLVPVQLIKKNIEEIEKSLGVKDFYSWIKTFCKNRDSWYEMVSFHVMLSIRDKIFTDYPQIRLFNSSKMENEIFKLNELFDFHKKMSKSAVDYQVSQARLKTEVPNKVYKMIENEANKTRRIKSPREVMENGALDVMLEWKRCWLMSPLSISQILPNTTDLFDVVIFDEASQVKLEDAIPSIYRGKSLIVVGDNKQMPPTNFFGGGFDDEDEEEFELAESLLDQAVKKYPSLMLEWHYRSEAESLIAFSNFAYYEGRLIVPPNPGTLCSSNALEFISVRNGCFDSKNGNEAEASMIVKEVRDILVNDPKSSLGVISMGMSQQKAINKLLDELSESDEKFAQAYNFSLNYYEDGSYKGFFNRNLENVQGDERDFIVLSVGYGPNKEGKFRKAFGPLSLDGGGRRLNVAITRARKKMKVYCSFNPSELSIDDNAFMSNPNTTTFARFLSYTKCVSENDEKSALQILNSFSNVKSVAITNDLFRSHIASELIKLGFNVREGIGNCGFVIDIGIFSGAKDEEFILGIDINKGVRGSSEFLRDSFKNRDSLLQKRGWKIYSLWMQDWIENKDGILNDLKGMLTAEFKKTA